MPLPCRAPGRATLPALSVLTVALVLAGLCISSMVGQSSPRAHAAVSRQLGYRATVDGFTSWYGSYGMGSLGTAWCIDHGIAAPDPAFAYRPTTPAVSESTRVAMAWIVGRHGYFTSRADSAALMLALHDLMGATYPSGRLDVDRLTPARMAGFGADEQAVLARARAMKAEGLDHAHLRGPYRLDIDSERPRAGQSGTLTARVLDANERAVDGVNVLVDADVARLDGPAMRTTDADGRIRLRFVAKAENRFHLVAAAPDLRLAAHGPTLRRAQRVAVPRQRRVEATHTFTAPNPPPPPPPPGEVVIEKTGDAEPLVPVTGATFEVRRGTSTVGSLTVGEDGRTDVLELEGGRYRIVETTAPPGYHPGEASEVEVRSGERTVVEVHNVARPGQLEIAKIDAVSGEPVTGATIQVARPGGGQPLATFVSAIEPTVLSDLRPGAYVVTESQPPAGYDVAPEPVEVTVLPGETARVTLANVPRSGLAFQKVADGPVPDGVSLAGAEFVVTVDDGEVGRCSTDDSGWCQLQDLPLRTGDTACWSELVAPEGFAAADEDCVVAGAAGTVTTVEVIEPSLFVEITATKSDAEDGTPLPGARYALHASTATIDDTGAGQDLGEGTELARATSGDDGSLAFGVHAPDVRYCVVELEAPAGYEVADRPECRVAVPGEPLHFELVDHRSPPEAAPAPPPTVSSGRPAPPDGPAAPVLPRTGADAKTFLLIGGGIVAIGVAIVIGAGTVGGDGRIRHQPRRRPSLLAEHERRRRPDDGD